jgi:hypothetical protein
MSTPDQRSGSGFLGESGSGVQEEVSGSGEPVSPTLTSGHEKGWCVGAKLRSRVHAVIMRNRGRG